jgi:predicted MPP superfamily phosphohydrolase
MCPSIVCFSRQYSALLRARERNARNAVVRTLRFTLTPPSRFVVLRSSISDIHADGLTGLSESLSQRLQDIQVDICVLTGDYRYKTHGPSHDVYPHMEKILTSINARHGMVGVLGNHDSWRRCPCSTAGRHHVGESVPPTQSW